MTTTHRTASSEELRSLPGYALAQAFRIMRHALDAALRDIGLTTPQWGTLKCIAEHEEISGAEMARLHHLTPQTMNTILQNLEHADLIRREHHPAHGTVLVIKLTETGWERLDEAVGRVLAVQDQMLSDFSLEERDLLLSLLNRCVAALTRDGPPEGFCPAV